MVDKITNNLINLENKTSKNSAKVKDSVSKVENYGNTDSADIKIEHKNVIKELASNAPIDYDKVSSIKKAISSGNYPLDLDKISDALMEAYNEIKSWFLVVSNEYHQ